MEEGGEVFFTYALNIEGISCDFLFVTFCLLALYFTACWAYVTITSYNDSAAA
jgi:hypothetical protein